MSSFQQSNDDFFSNPMASVPKQSTRLSQARGASKATSASSATTSSSSNPTRLAKRSATTTRRAPPPPPNNSKGSTAASTTAGASSSSNAKARPARRRPNRLPAPSAQTLQPSSSSATTAANTASSSTNSFYGSNTGSSAAAAAPAAAGMGGTGFYNYSTPSPAPANTGTRTNSATPEGDQQWDSWASPAPAAAAAAPVNAVNPQQQQQQQPVNQWQASGTTSTAATSTMQPQASTNDWYSGASTMDTTTAPTAAAPVPAYNQWQGSMDNASAVDPNIPASQPSMFQPSAFFSSTTTTSGNMSPADDEIDFENEAPLLEELGIHFDHILLKTKTVCWPFSRTASLQEQNKNAMVDAVVQDADLIGPICYCLALGGEMVLAGKLQFGYIYGFGLFGCVAMTLIVNLTAPKDAVSFWVVSSVLGYSLLPVNILALVKIVVMNLASLQKLGRVLGLITVLWSTTASTRLLEIGCGLREQRYLIAYPIALLYSAFVLITIF